MSFDLQIISPEKKIFTGKVKKITVPALTGQITILSHHTPLFTPLLEGKIIVTDLNNKVLDFSIGKGMVEVKNNEVVLLSEPPESTDRISQIKIKKAYKQADILEQQQDKPTGKIETEDAFRRSLIDLKGIKRKKRLNQPVKPPTG
jgi:F-type H+-transporting ATPase subunit epsilon